MPVDQHQKTKAEACSWTLIFNSASEQNLPLHALVSVAAATGHPGAAVRNFKGRWSRWVPIRSNRTPQRTANLSERHCASRSGAGKTSCKGAGPPADPQPGIYPSVVTVSGTKSLWGPSCAGPEVTERLRRRRSDPPDLTFAAGWRNCATALLQVRAKINTPEQRTTSIQASSTYAAGDVPRAEGQADDPRRHASSPGWRRSATNCSCRTLA